LNAPWKLNSDRTNIIPGPWNESLMLAAADLIAANIGYLATEDDPGAPISALPRKPDRQNDPAVPLVEALWGKLVNLEIVPDTSGQLKTARELYRHPIEEVELVERWVALAGQIAMPVWSIPVVTRANLVLRDWRRFSEN
jgi:hypothetical protein